jgi:hypothetical protein
MCCVLILLRSKHVYQTPPSMDHYAIQIFAKTCKFDSNNSIYCGEAKLGIQFILERQIFDISNGAYFSSSSHLICILLELILKMHSTITI